MNKKVINSKDVKITIGSKELKRVTSINLKPKGFPKVIKGLGGYYQFTCNLK